MKIIHFILLLILFFISSTFSVLAVWDNHKIYHNIIPYNESIAGTNIDNNSDAEYFDINDLILYAKKAMFSLFYIVAVWVFIFLWIKLMAARWNAEEFKKALMWFVYAIVWIVLIPLAYVLVSLVSWVNF